VTPQELTGLIGALGFPIVLVISGLWFVKKDFFPWWVKYMSERATAQDARHKDYTETIQRSSEALEALVELMVRIENQMQTHTNKLEIIEATVLERTPIVR